MSDYLEFGIVVPFGAKGEYKTTCPQCSRDRKKNSAKCLSVNIDKGIWHCNHCEWSGRLKSCKPWDPPEVYKKPAEKPRLPLTKAALDWFHGRGITNVVLGRNQVSSDGDSVVFPYFRDGELINRKYRALSEKKFWMEQDAERIFWGLDDVRDESVILIVEGELDRLSLEVAGFRNVLSVPNGAPKPDAKNLSNSLSYIATAEVYLSSATEIALAGDNDAPGKFLRNEIARRLGRERCSIVTWPEDCKDANDVLTKHGAEGIRDSIDDRKMYPVSGIISVEDVSEDIDFIYEHGLERGVETGWKALDSYYSVRPGEMTVVSGIPGSGKSVWLDCLLVNLARLHGWTFAMFSPENQPLPDHVGRMVEKYAEVPFRSGPMTRMSREQLKEGKAWVAEHFVWLLPEDSMDWHIETILDLAKVVVFRKGIRGLVIDPWNELEHLRPEGMSETEYVGRCLKHLRQFARSTGVHVWLVAHPQKLYRGKDGKYPVPTLYDCSGCYSADTDVLTERGWMRHDKILANDRVCCFDPISETLSYQTPTALTRFAYEGNMVRVKSDSLDALVTPNHRMVVQCESQQRLNVVGSGRGRPFKYSPIGWSFIEASELTSTSLLLPWSTELRDEAPSFSEIEFSRAKQDVQAWCSNCRERAATTKGRCPRCNTYFALNGEERLRSKQDKETPDRFEMVDFLRFVGWWIAEGSTNGAGGLNLCQVSGSLAEEMRATLSRMRLIHTERFQRPTGKGKQTMWVTTVSKKAHRRFCEWVAINCGVGCAKKRVPDLTWALSVEHKRVLLEALIDGDGSRARGNASYFTTSPELADQVQRLAIECGRMASIRSQAGARSHHLRRYAVAIGRQSRKKIGLYAKRHVRAEAYLGMVYCLTVPTGAYVTRRNGRPGIYGNSSHFRNKADNGIVVWRDMANAEELDVDLHIQKIRFRQVGRLGKATLRYVRSTATYEDPAQPELQRERF